MSGIAFKYLGKVPFMAPPERRSLSPGTISKRMMNGMMEHLSNCKWRELPGRRIFGLQETE